MAKTSLGFNILFSLRENGATNPVDIQCTAGSCEFGAVVDYSLESAGEGLAEFRCNHLVDVVHCLLTRGDGSSLSPENYLKDLHVVAWSDNKAHRIVKKVLIPSDVLNTIEEEIKGTKIDRLGFAAKYAELLSVEKIVTREYDLVD